MFFVVSDDQVSFDIQIKKVFFCQISSLSIDNFVCHLISLINVQVAMSFDVSDNQAHFAKLFFIKYLFNQLILSSCYLISLINVQAAMFFDVSDEQDPLAAKIK